jgi:hypothetical protein
MAFPLREVATLGQAAEVRSVYREFAPSSDLADAAACTWEGSGGWARALRLLPDGGADLEPALAPAHDCFAPPARRPSATRLSARSPGGSCDGHEPDHIVLAAAPVLEAGASVPATAREVSVSPRELRRRFQTHLGYGPKAFARVVRSRRYISELRTTTTAQLSWPGSRPSSATPIRRT